MKGICANLYLSWQQRICQRSGWLFQVEEKNSSTPISLPENICYILSLFRTHKRENFFEAKRLLERFCAFEKAGAFPRLLQQYPDPGPISSQIEILLALSLIDRDFGSLLEKELCELLRKTLFTLYRWLHNHLHDQELLTIFDAYLMGKSPPILSLEQRSYREVLNILLAYALIGYPEEIVQKALDLIDPTTLLFLGKKKDQLYRKGIPERGIFPLFFQNIFPEDIEEYISHFGPDDYRIFLLAPFEPLQRSIVTKKEPFFSKENDFYSLIWKEERELYALCAQFSCEHVCQRENNLLTIDCDLLESDGSNPFFGKIFLNQLEIVQPYINEKKATYMQQGDRVIFQTKQKKISLFFSGTHPVTGHLMQGNKPGEMAALFSQAYDWVFSLRSIGSEKGKVTLTLQIDNV